MNDAIKVRATGTMEVIDYQPGNGTRYLVQVVEVDGAASKMMGMGGAKGWVITHLNNPRSKTFTFPSYCQWVFPHEIADKMDEGGVDADALAKLIAHVTGAEYAGDN